MKGISTLRILFHLSGAIIPVTYLAMGRMAAVTLSVLLLLLLLIGELLRIKGWVSMPFVERQLKDRELARPTGSLFYVVSCCIVALLFDRVVASASMLILALADPSSSVVGRLWGKRRLFLDKSIEGTATFFSVAFVILLVFSFSLPVALFGAAVATTAELFSAGVVDDNFSIPLAAAFAVWAARALV
jgi:dolichol kinase